jgi:chromosome segregation and condensation protein ScpB
MASMAQTQEKSERVEKELKKLYGDNDVELEEISKGYEEIRKMVDHAVIHRVVFK